MIITERKNGYCIDGEYDLTLTRQRPAFHLDKIDECDIPLHITGFWFRQTDGIENKLRSTLAAIRFIWLGKLS